jgi:hypothetical protein
MKEAIEVKAPEKRSYRQLEQIHIKKVKGPNGGHLVMHHFAPSETAYHKPQEHMFGKDEGSDLMAHLAKHLGVKGEASGEEKAEPENQEEAASEPATANVNA